MEIILIVYFFRIQLFLSNPLTKYYNKKRWTMFVKNVTYYIIKPRASALFHLNFFNFKNNIFVLLLRVFNCSCVIIIFFNVVGI